MPCNVLYLAFGRCIQTYTFATHEMGKEWTKEVQGIKRAIEDINGSIVEDTPKITSDDWYMGWLMDVKNFRTRWGDNYVPIDIRSSVNSVEEGVGVPGTAW
jgi:hypothetical protein